MVCSAPKLIEKVMRLEEGKLYGRNRVREEEKGGKEARNGIREKIEFFEK